MSPFECSTAAATASQSFSVIKEGPLPHLRRSRRQDGTVPRKCEPVRVLGKWADCPTDSPTDSEDEAEEEVYEAVGAHEARLPLHSTCWRCGAAPGECDPAAEGPPAAPTASLLGLPGVMANSAGAVPISIQKVKEGKFQEAAEADEAALADALFHHLLWCCEAASAGVAVKLSNEETSKGKHQRKPRLQKASFEQRAEGVTQVALRRVDALSALLQRCRERLLSGEVSVSSGAEAVSAAAATVAAAETAVLEQNEVLARQSKKKGGGQAKEPKHQHQQSADLMAPQPTAEDLGLPLAMHKSVVCASAAAETSFPRSPDPFVMYEPPATEDPAELQKKGEEAFGCLMSCITADVDDKAAREAAAMAAVADAAEGDSCETLRQHLQDLGREHPERVLCLRKINRLGFDSRALLERHYAWYGLPNRILVAHLFTRASRRRSARMRPAGVGFMVMETEADAERILALGEEQNVGVCSILVQRFEPPKGDGIDVFGGADDEEDGQCSANFD